VLNWPESTLCPLCVPYPRHAQTKALGYGTHDGRYLKGYTEGVYVDIMNEQGELMTETAVCQISPIPDLPMDLNQVVTREGEQVQTVGHHWPLDGPLSEDQRIRMERAGACFACHQHIPDGAISYRILAAVGSRLGPDARDGQGAPHADQPDHARAGNVEVFGTLLLVLLIIGGAFWLKRRRS
jgi:hypothetical protein